MVLLPSKKTFQAAYLANVQNDLQSYEKKMTFASVF